MSNIKRRAIVNMGGGILIQSISPTNAVNLKDIKYLEGFHSKSLSNLKISVKSDDLINVLVENKNYENFDFDIHLSLDSDDIESEISSSIVSFTSEFLQPGHKLRLDSAINDFIVEYKKNKTLKESDSLYSFS